MTFWIIHTPDLICAFRAITAIIALLLGVHPLTPVLFTISLISDFFDGWFFRRFVQHHPAWHPWNPLPVTFDPLADLVLLLSGVIYAGIYLLNFNSVQFALTLFIIISGGLSLTTLPLILPRRSALVYTICMTTLTHVACCMMIMAPIVAWYVCRPDCWIIGSGSTICLFYGIFLLIGEKGRLIRRPPADFFYPPPI